MENAKKEDDLVFEWGNLLSMRFWWTSLFVGLVLGMAPLGLVAWIFPFEFSDIPQFVVWLFVAPAILLMFFVGLIGDALDCPECGKNVKQGHSKCHHCGHDQNAA